MSSGERERNKASDSEGRNPKRFHSICCGLDDGKTSKQQVGESQVAVARPDEIHLYKDKDKILQA